MRVLRPCVVLLLALAIAGSAAAEPVATFRYGRGADLTTASPEASRKAPKGVGGFYDPSTRTFTPLEKSPQADPQVFSGNISVEISIDYKDNPLLDGTETARCVIQLAFGNKVNGDFFPNHYVYKKFSMALKDNAEELVDYTYASNGNGEPSVKVAVDCSTAPLAPFYLVHSGGGDTTAAPLKNGTSVEIVDIYL